MEMNTVSGALRGEGELEGGGLGSACVCLRESEGESEKEGGRNIRDTAIEGKVIQRITSLSVSPCFCCRL